ncbi:MAG: AAA family ATPase, partial [Alistipes sp.]|nr:AAA family ATPase [Alistipes sp.]
MPTDVVTAFKDNKVYAPESISGLSPEKFFDAMAKIFDDYESGDNITQKIDSLVGDNMHLEYCKAAKLLDLGDADERLLFYIFCNRFINEDDDMIGEHDWEDYFESKSTLRMIRGEMKRRENGLFRQGIFENCNSDGMSDTSYFKLTNKAKDMLFKDLNIGQQQAKNQKELLKHNSFAEKSLFYNPRERSQIEQLSELLMPEKFASVQQRLEENGMRKGFACLFYGSPGTGKTETVYQLARRTQRDLMVVDVSQIKSCWVGESEKNIKAAFDRYRNYVKQCERAPILLFNEADAVLGIRQEGAQRAVEKMENSIQNIILQEMEQLDGIMIATTNLTQNLDKAFERRFLYKIEFSRPSLEAKRSIWQSMIPTLAVPLAEQLAAEYDFSGGQIENIARKRTVELILNGEEPSSEKLHAMCRAEQLANSDSARRRIGF